MAVHSKCAVIIKRRNTFSGWNKISTAFFCHAFDKLHNGGFACPLFQDGNGSLDLALARLAKHKNNNIKWCGSLMDGWIVYS